MRRITQNEIDAVIGKLLEPLVAKEETFNNAIKILVEDYVYEQYPVELRKLVIAKNPFLNYFSHLYVEYLGQTRCIGFGSPGIVAKKNQIRIEDRQLAESIQLHVNSIKSIQQEREQMYSELRATLKSLRTFEKICKEFPEAAKFLPEEIGANVPALNIAVLQNKLASLV